MSDLVTRLRALGGEHPDDIHNLAADEIERLTRDPEYKLIESYYAVSQHLQEQAERKAEIAELLAKMADAMGEARIKRTPADTRG